MGRSEGEAEGEAEGWSEATSMSSLEDDGKKPSSPVLPIDIDKSEEEEEEEEEAISLAPTLSTSDKREGLSSRCSESVCALELILDEDALSSWKEVTEGSSHHLVTVGALVGNEVAPGALEGDGFNWKSARG